MEKKHLRANLNGVLNCLKKPFSHRAAVLLLTAILIFASAGAVYASTGWRITVNDNEVQFNPPPFEEDGLIYALTTEIAKYLGLIIDEELVDGKYTQFLDEDKELFCYFSEDENFSYFIAGNIETNTFYQNTKETLTLRGSITEDDGQTYVTIGKILEFYGYGFDLNSDRRVMEITTPGFAEMSVDEQLYERGEDYRLGRRGIVRDSEGFGTGAGAL